jgi:WD40 repeat protein
LVAKPIWHAPSVARSKRGPRGNSPRWLSPLDEEGRQRWLTSAGKDKTIRLWDLSNLYQGTLARPIWSCGHEDRITAAAWSPSGDRLTTFTHSLDSKTQVVFAGHGNLVVITVFHPEGRWVATAGGDHMEILLWNPRIRNSKILSRIEDLGRTDYTVVFSKDSRHRRCPSTLLMLDSSPE